MYWGPLKGAAYRQGSSERCSWESKQGSDHVGLYEQVLRSLKCILRSEESLRGLKAGIVTRSFCVSQVTFFTVEDGLKRRRTGEE